MPFNYQVITGQPNLSENTDLLDPELSTKSNIKPSQGWYVAVLNNQNVWGPAVALAIMSEFKISDDEAIRLMMRAHNEGQALIKGGYSEDVAQTKANNAEGVVRQVHEQRGLPYPDGVVCFIADTTD